MSKQSENNKYDKWNPDFWKRFPGTHPTTPTFSIRVKFKKNCPANKKEEIFKEIKKIFMIEENKWDSLSFTNPTILGGIFSKDFYESIRDGLKNYIKEESKNNIEDFNIDFHDTIHPYVQNVPKGLEKYISRIFAPKEDGWTKNKLHKEVEECGDFGWIESYDGISGFSIKVQDNKKKKES